PIIAHAAGDHAAFDELRGLSRCCVSSFRSSPRLRLTTCLRGPLCGSWQRAFGSASSCSRCSILISNRRLLACSDICSLGQEWMRANSSRLKRIFLNQAPLSSPEVSPPQLLASFCSSVLHPP